MRPMFFCAFIVSMASICTRATAQTVEGDILRGQAAFAAGAGWYNLQTARGNAINVQALRNYNEEVRLNYANSILYWTEKQSKRKLAKAEALRRAHERMRRIKDSPTVDDIRSGDALNMLTIALTDPNVSQQDWYARAVPLPAKVSVKDVVFDYYPNGMTSNDLKISVSLSLLGKGVDWPVAFTPSAFADERDAYEEAAARVKANILKGKFEPSEMTALEESLDALLAEVSRTYANDKRGYLAKSKEFQSELRSATRLFDGEVVDYAKELLTDTDLHDVKTVGELVAFMLKYRLLFAPAARPRSAELYTLIHGAMREQAGRIGAKTAMEFGAIESKDGMSETTQQPQAPSDIDPSSTSPLGLREVTNSIGMRLVLVPAGAFVMGSPPTEPGREKDEAQHHVQITQPFYLSMTEVTQGQWQALMGTSPWKDKKFVMEGANYPATFVDWTDAITFCQRLSEKEGQSYTLPTEAEWEYACRGGEKTTYSFGNNSQRLSDFAWWGGRYGSGNSKGEPYAHEVALKLPNKFGLYDMHGNVWEWCNDWHNDNYYGSSPLKDPQGPRSGKFRIYRGGGWADHPGYCRAAERAGTEPTHKGDVFGFRVRLSVPQ